MTTSGRGCRWARWTATEPPKNSCMLVRTAAAAAADNDHLGVQDFGEPGKRVPDTAGQFPELDLDACVAGLVPVPGRRDRSRRPRCPIRQVGVDRSRLHRSVGMFVDEVVVGLYVRADQHRVELPREPSRPLHHDRRLLRRDPGHHVSASIRLGHRFATPSN